jgi:adenylate kinase family enzyme
MPHRIHILGASGTGKTTLGRALAESLHCPHFDTDDYFWLPSDPPYQHSRTPAEQRALMAPDLHENPGWVLTGSIARDGPFIPLLDLVVFLWMPLEARLARLIARERARFGEAAPAPGGTMHETHQEFLAEAAAYETADASVRSRARHERWLDALPCPLLRLEGDGSTADQVAQVRHSLETGPIAPAG